MKDGFARKEIAKAPGFNPETIELPTPLKIPPPQGKSPWMIVLVIGLIGLFGAMMLVSFASGARSFTGGGSLFPILMMGGLVAMLFGGRGGSQEMSRTKLDAARAQFCHYVDELRETTSGLADKLDRNYRWYHPPPATLEAAVGSVRMWERKANGSDTWFGVARVGVGMTDLVESHAAMFAEPQNAPTDIEMEPVTGKVLADFMRAQTVSYGTPALVSMLVEPGYELRGPREQVLALVRAMICQLVFFHGPDHVRLIVVSSDVREWDWVKWLPHAGDPQLEDGAGPVRMVHASVDDFLVAHAESLGLRGRGDFRPRPGSAKDPISPLPHTVVVCDAEGGWDGFERSGINGLTFLGVRGGGQVPACSAAQRVLYVDEGLVVSAVPRDPMTWDALPAAPEFFAFADQMSRDDAEAFAERMARWRLAEAYEAIGMAVAPRVMARDILAYYGIDDAAHIDFEALWSSRSDINSSQMLRVPLGSRSDNNELFFVDLKAEDRGGDGPHGVMSGTTGSGKTMMLRALIESLMLGHPPQNLQFMLADLKGGSGVRPFAGVPHVSQIITDLEGDQSLLSRFIDALEGELARRKAVCDRAGADDATEYNKIRSDQISGGDAEVLPPLPALVVIIDEFAELYKLLGNEIHEVLDGICRQGRAYWVHLHMASQEIGTRAEKLLENMAYRLALQARTAGAATLSGVPHAVHLKGSGQCYFLQGSPASGTLTKFQGEYLWREYRKPGVDYLESAGPADGGSVSYFAPQLFGTDFVALPSADDGQGAVLGDERGGHDDHDGQGEHVQRGGGQREERPTALMRPQVGRMIIEQLRRIDFEPYRLWKPPLDAPWTIERLVNTHLQRRWNDTYAATPDLRVPVGLVDRPFKHDQHPLIVDMSGSGANVMVVGGSGSGKTTVVQSLVCAAAMTHTSEQVQFYCLAFSSAALKTVEGLAHVSGVAQALDGDGVRRTVSELYELLELRKRSFGQAGVMSMEVFRRRKAGQETGNVPDDNHGDVFLVIDNYAAMATQYPELVEMQVNRIIREGPTFGIHTIVAVTKTTDLQVTVRSDFGSRVELRLADTNDASEPLKPRMVAKVPMNRPGRGMIPQNYERVGSELIGLHTLMARPALESDEAGLFDSRSVVAAVNALNRGFSQAPKVRRLPTHISAVQVGELAAGDPRLATNLVWALDEAERPVFFDGQHLVVTGQPECGRTTVCATIMCEIARVYAPGGDEAPPAAAGRRTAQVWLIDPRRQLTRVLSSAYVHRFASAPEAIAQRMQELTEVLRPRMPRDTLSIADIERRVWEGPEIFVVVDDSERLPGGYDSPLQALGPLVQLGADVGLHVIYSRQFGPFMGGMGDPILKPLRDSASPVLVMDSNPDDGFVKGKWKGHSMPAGRGFLINSAVSGVSGIYVQVSDPGMD